MPHPGSRHCDAARGRREPRLGHVDKHRTAPPGDARTHIVADFNNEMIETTGAPSPMAGTASRYLDMAIVAAIRRFLAPSVPRADPAGLKRGWRPRAAIRAPPHTHPTGT